MTKDPHPDPPLRVLPEHSVLENESGAPRPTLSGGASPHGLGGLDGTANHSSLPQQHASTDTTTFDFAQSMGANDKSSNPPGPQVQSGKMTFTLPNFGQDNGGAAAAAAAPRETVLSPTQPTEGDELSIPGAFAHEI
jgi:hypothetical protein